MLGSLLEPGRFDAVCCAGLARPAVERMVAAGKTVHVASTRTLGEVVLAFVDGEAMPLTVDAASAC